MNNLTFVRGERDPETLDPVSRQILDAGSGTSIFDPVLCELAYRWFCPPGGLVLDPFAGGSARGIVASRLGRRYVGIDLRPEQVEANRAQGKALCGEPIPAWIEGDSLHVRELAAGIEADFAFSCPPYADLERYSDDPRDLSTMPYPEFRDRYARIIANTLMLLREDRFAAFVVGDVRGPDGFYRGFPWHTIDAFERAGARLYNELILVTAVGSLPVRAGRAFAASRKIGKTHQQVLVFCKGDPVRATEACGECEFGELAPDDAEPENDTEDEAQGATDDGSPA
ncbi:DNA methyltransferase [Elioraea sp.]|uniref:DNA methyltransferase n=1 Tax=Elioraea sp. TaxID=2185103 RepID=UPI003F6EEBA3